MILRPLKTFLFTKSIRLYWRWHFLFRAPVLKWLLRWLFEAPFLSHWLLEHEHHLPLASGLSKKGHGLPCSSAANDKKSRSPLKINLVQVGLLLVSLMIASAGWNGLTCDCLLTYKSWPSEMFRTKACIWFRLWLSISS